MLTVERIRAFFAPNTPKDLDRPLTDFRSVFSIWYRVVHGLGRPAGRVGLGRVGLCRDFALFNGLDLVGSNMTKVGLLYF